MDRKRKRELERDPQLDEDHVRTKKELARAITEAINQEKVGQRDAARILNLTQPKISALANGKVRGFSLQKLMEILIALGLEVEIVIKKKKGGSTKAAKIHITAA